MDGLFPAAERPPVMRLLERAVVFLAPETIADVLTAQRWPHTAWQLANLYLGSLGCAGLDGQPAGVVGLSQETTCYLSLTYFTEPDPFADFLIHEAAHVFHNWKRESVGLPHTRTREWLLDIGFHWRETFAYACEVYSRIRTLEATRRERVRLLQEYAAKALPILSLISIIFIMKSALWAGMSVPFALFIYVLEILVAFLQAYIFTMLTSLFIGMAVHPAH